MLPLTEIGKTLADWQHWKMASGPYQGVQLPAPPPPMKLPAPADDELPPGATEYPGKLHERGMPYGAQQSP